MLELQPTIITTLRKYMRDDAAFVDASTTLADLEIDALDLPMIFLDVEDLVGVQITYAEEVEGFQTVGDLVGCVARRLAAKASNPKVRIARPKRGWMTA